MRRPSELAGQAPGAFLTVMRGAQADELERFGTFTTVVPRGNDRWSGRQVGLLLDEGWLQEVGTLRPGRIAASGLRQLRYRREFVVTPVSIAELEARLAPHLRRHFVERAALGGRIPLATWAATLRLLEEDSFEVPGALAELMQTIGGRSTGLRGDALQIAAHERDAVRSALDFAGFDRDVLGAAVPGAGASFVERLGDVVAPEDPTISYDSLRFLDFEAIDSPSGVVQLVKDGEELIVINVNRRRLETTLGADLIYVNESLDSLVFVQYKTMRDKLNGQPVYRPLGDGSVDAEITRLAQIPLGDDDQLPRSFRLDSRGAFLKLCVPVTALRRQKTGPISGMYLPLDLYRAYVESPEAAKGPLGGVALGYATVDRYLTNTQFAELVRGGWVGSRTTASHHLTKMIIAALGQGRSVTVAAKRPRS